MMIVVRWSSGRDTWLTLTSLSRKQSTSAACLVFRIFSQMWIRKHNKENRFFQKSSENCRNFECFLNAFYVSCFQASGLHLILHQLFAEALIPVALLSMDWNSSVSCSLRHCDEFWMKKGTVQSFQNHSAFLPFLLFLPCARAPSISRI